ncbi:Protein DEHYDRATION-INDUCED 19 homolog 5 [Linum perenne]
MEDDKWSNDNYQLDPKFLSDLCIDFESLEDTDEYLMADYPCPYCGEDFDLVELCCHIDDEHQFDSNSEDDMDMVGHITSLHGDMLKISFPVAHSLQKLKRRKGDLRSSLSLLKKDSEDEELSLYSRPCATTIVSHTDPFLSFIQSMPSLNKAENAQPFHSSQIDAGKGKSEDKQCYRLVFCHPMNSCF